MWAEISRKGQWRVPKGIEEPRGAWEAEMSRWMAWPPRDSTPPGPWPGSPLLSQGEGTWASTVPLTLRPVKSLTGSACRSRTGWG